MATHHAQMISSLLLFNTESIDIADHTMPVCSASICKCGVGVGSTRPQLPSAPPTRCRCKAEAQLPEQLRSTMDAIHTACEALSQQVEDAVDAGDVQQLVSTYQRLLDMQADFEGQLKAAKPNVKTKRWAQVS